MINLPRKYTKRYKIQINFRNDTNETLTYSETKDMQISLVEKTTISPGCCKNVLTLTGNPWSIDRSIGIIAVYTPTRKLKPNQIVEIITLQENWETVKNIIKQTITLILLNNAISHNTK